jgi:hypothetical protein
MERGTVPILQGDYAAQRLSAITELRIDEPSPFA